jgi:hypothetical protein
MVIAASAAACVARTNDDDGLAARFEPPFAERVGKGAEPERWNDVNDPSSVGTFVYDAAKLPLSGAATIKPTPGDYWPAFEDSINRRWDGDGSLSPAEKYEKAFGRAGAAAAVSKAFGIHSADNRPSCREDRECAVLKDGSACGIARGEAAGRCIPTWWGICNGWAPFAIDEKAPLKTVIKNGVTFYPGDLEALLSLIYADGLQVHFLADRCDDPNPAVDASGRMRASECRDMNPGSFHVLLTNMVGMKGASFLFDGSADEQVWTYPVRSYQVLNASNQKLTEVPILTATELVTGHASSTYTFDPDAKRFFYVTLQLAFVTEADPARFSHAPDVDAFTETRNLEYVLEADAQGLLIGGEWVAGSRMSHPDFAWWPAGGPSAAAANGAIRYDEVKALDDQAATP